MLFSKYPISGAGEGEGGGGKNWAMAFSYQSRSHCFEYQILTLCGENQEGPSDRGEVKKNAYFS